MASVVPLVDEPNIVHRETDFVHDHYITHRWCRRANGKRYRVPMFVRVNQGPIRCERCGRRASRFLRKLMEEHCHPKSYDEPEGKLTYYHFYRADLNEKGLKSSWIIVRALIEELRELP